MSTFTCSTATASKTAAAEPGSSGSPVSVNTTSSSECVTAETIGCSMTSTSSTKVPGSSDSVERAWIRTPCAACDLHRSQHQHLCPRRGHLEHFLVRDHRQSTRFRYDPRVGREHARHVRVDLARGAERGCQRDRRSVGPASAERRHVHRVAREALEPGDEHDLPVFERLEHPHRRDLPDLGLRVDGVGEDPRLRAGERHRLLPEVVYGHRDERARGPLSRREQHVELPRIGARGHAARELEQRVRRAAHRRDRPDDTQPALMGGDEPACDLAHPLRLAHRRAAELHDDGFRLRLRRGGHAVILPEAALDERARRLVARQTWARTPSSGRGT